MKKLLNLLLVFLLSFSLVGCSTNNTDQNNLPNDISVNTDERPTGPSLDVDVTADMDFFKDGYEIVTLKSTLDGDTAVFTLKSGTYSTRFLCIDTPETSNGLDPWGMTAKDYTIDKLTNAKEIILEKDPVLSASKADDPNTFDTYDRLLAFVWVDGELLQWDLVDESLAYVRYLYEDYKYNEQLINLESYVIKNDNRRVHNEEDLEPGYNYDDTIKFILLKNLAPENMDKIVETKGVITRIQDRNVYFEDDGKGMYIYTNHGWFDAFEVGNEIEVTGQYTSYSNQYQIANIVGDIKVLSKDNEITPKAIDVSGLCEENESLFVKMNDFTVTEIKGSSSTGFTILGTQNNTNCQVRIDKYVTRNADHYNLDPLPFEVGKTYNLVGNVGQYNDDYQFMICDGNDIKLK